jgi:DNA-binding FadR family transcriptional regulator
MSGVRDLLQRSLVSVFYIPGVPARVIVQHRAILDAISTGQSEPARAAMFDHLTHVEQEIHGIVGTPPGTSPIHDNPRRRR